MAVKVNNAGESEGCGAHRRLGKKGLRMSAEGGLQVKTGEGAKTAQGASPVASGPLQLPHDATSISHHILPLTGKNGGRDAKSLCEALH